jgi:hypothetical protein
VKTELARDSIDLPDNRIESRVVPTAGTARAYEQAVALRDACVRFARPRRDAPQLVEPPKARKENPLRHPHEDAACDFLAYLEWRLGTERDATAEMLGDWLVAYRLERRSEDRPAKPDADT